MVLGGLEWGFYQIVYDYIENSIISSMVSQRTPISQIIYIGSRVGVCPTSLFYKGLCMV
jgi:uncharacterized membrane protein YuzA (DUF378 family)